jgi:hypothetical protein
MLEVGQVHYNRREPALLAQIGSLDVEGVLVSAIEWSTLLAS